jgi:hypothetical protein
MDAVRRSGRASDVWWFAWAILGGLSVFSSLLVAALSLVEEPGMRTFETLGGALGWWWIVRGAWLRTRAGRPHPETPPAWSEPPLTPRRAWWLTWLGAACAVAAAIAVTIQATHWVG